MVNLAEIARQRGELARAAAFLEQALGSARAHQASWDIAIITTLLGHLACQQQNYPLAKDSHLAGLQHRT